MLRIDSLLKNKLTWVKAYSEDVRFWQFKIYTPAVIVSTKNSLPCGLTMRNLCLYLENNEYSWSKVILNELD